MANMRVGLKNHHWIHKLIANLQGCVWIWEHLEKKPLTAMQKVRDIYKRFNNFFNNKTKSKTNNSKNNCSNYDDNGNNNIIEIKTPSNSRWRKYEKNMFAEVICAIKQVSRCHRENSYEGTINLLGVMFPNGKTAANME